MCSRNIRYYFLILLAALATRVEAQTIPFPSIRSGLGGVFSRAAHSEPADPSTIEPMPAVGEYFDLDQHMDGGPVYEGEVYTEHIGHFGPDYHEFQILPSGLIYKPYLAGQKEPGFSVQIFKMNEQGWTFDGKLGTQVGLIRYGDRDPVFPSGFQIDAEGSAQLRMNIPDDMNVYAVDFRAGLPITFGDQRYQTKLGYYHLSSHVGDEFLLLNPGFERLNYSRDVLMFGQSFYVTPKLRLYGEIDWAFYSEIAEPWELQFGVDYAPCGPTGIWGAPFFAFNTHLRQEVNFGGLFVFQAGWAWRGEGNSHLLRMGLHYLNGESPQYSFHDEFEQQIGFGVWYTP